MTFSTRKIQGGLTVAVPVTEIRTVPEQLRASTTAPPSQSVWCTNTIKVLWLYKTAQCVVSTAEVLCRRLRTRRALCASPFMQLYMSGVQPLVLCAEIKAPCRLHTVPIITLLSNHRSVNIEILRKEIVAHLGEKCLDDIAVPTCRRLV